MVIINEYKTNTPFQKRLETSRSIKDRYRERVPVILQQDSGSSIVIHKFKYLVPKDADVAKMLDTIRKEINLNASQGLYLFVGNKVLGMGENIELIYNRHHDPDGFLYITIAGENTFG